MGNCLGCTQQTQSNSRQRRTAVGGKKKKQSKAAQRHKDGDAANTREKSTKTTIQTNLLDAPSAGTPNVDMAVPTVLSSNQHGSSQRERNGGMTPTLASSGMRPFKGGDDEKEEETEVVTDDGIVKPVPNPFVPPSLGSPAFRFLNEPRVVREQLTSPRLGTAAASPISRRNEEHRLVTTPALRSDTPGSHDTPLSEFAFPCGSQPELLRTSSTPKLSSGEEQRRYASLPEPPSFDRFVPPSSSRTSSLAQSSLLQQRGGSVASSFTRQASTVSSVLTLHEGHNDLLQHFKLGPGSCTPSGGEGGHRAGTQRRGLMFRQSDAGDSADGSFRMLDDIARSNSGVDSARSSIAASGSLDAFFHRRLQQQSPQATSTRGNNRGGGGSSVSPHGLNANVRGRAGSVSFAGSDMTPPLRDRGSMSSRSPATAAAAAMTEPSLCSNGRGSQVLFSSGGEDSFVQPLVQQQRLEGPSHTIEISLPKFSKR